MALDNIGCHHAFWRVGEWKMLHQSADPPSPLYRVRFDRGRQAGPGHDAHAWLNWPATGGPTNRQSDEAPIDVLLPAPNLGISVDGRVAVDVFTRPGQAPRPRKVHLARDRPNDRENPALSARHEPWSFRVSPDGRHLRSPNRETFFVLDVETGKILTNRSSHLTVYFSGFDRRRTARGSHERSAASRFVMAISADPSGPAYSACVHDGSPNGQRVETGAGPLVGL